MKAGKALVLSISILLFLFSFCKKDVPDPGEWIHGLWVSNSNDSLCFTESMLFINNGFPYMYRVSSDSLATCPSWSSSLDMFYNKIDIDRTNDEINIYDFLSRDVILFKRVSCTCTYNSTRK